MSLQPSMLVPCRILCAPQDSSIVHPPHLPWSLLPSKLDPRLFHKSGLLLLFVSVLPSKFGAVPQLIIDTVG